MAIIYLVRHGQASFSSSDYDQLSQLGIKQSQLLGELFQQRDCNPKLIVSGSMKRQLETANYCLPSLKKQFETDERWNEYNHEALLESQLNKIGNYTSIKSYVMAQDQPMRAFQNLLNQAISDWMDGKTEHPTKWEKYQSNSWEALTEISDQLQSGEKAMVFTSGGPISSIVMQLLDLPSEKFIYLQNRIVNTSITRILKGKSGLSLSTFNDYGHLEHDRKLVTYR